jgi:glutamate-1-semialdehyde 2,1-aminomutase
VQRVSYTGEESDVPELTKDEAAATAGGLRFHPGEERRYRERTPRSRELLERTRRLIPTGHAGGMWYQMPYPVLLERAKGSRVWDVDGNEYLDLRIGDWVLINGHCSDEIRDAIVAQLDRAVQFGSPEWDLAYRMASLLIERMPSVERVRFMVSGTETNLLALRLARAHTGRTKLAKATGSYHGIADVLVVGSSTISFVTNTVPPGVTPGVAQDVIEFPFNDPDGAEEVIEREAANLAAVIVEPVMGAAGMIPATTEFLQRLREVTERHGIVLIFDEVVTFPIAYGGAQAYHGINPDLTTMSKAIGGGLPLAALGGREELMDLLDPEAHDGMAPVTAASTFGGNQAALAAGIACLELLTPEAHARVQALSERGKNGIDELGRRYEVPLHATGLGHIFAMHWAPEPVVDYRTRMQDDSEKIVNLGIALMNLGYYHFSFGSFLLSTAITEQDIDDLIAAIEQALHNLDLVS